jgi:hypothetical protein
MSKGSAENAAGNTGLGRQEFTDLNNRSTDVYNRLFPFLNSEMHNPQGYGPGYIKEVNQGTNDMRTTSGQATSGALGQATEAATLLGSRTGNTAAMPGIIDVASRNAAKQQSNNLLDIDATKQNLLLQNEKEKALQRQQGASGEAGLYGDSLHGALAGLGLSNDAIGEWTKGKSAANDNIMDWAKLVENGAMAGAGI